MLSSIKIINLRVDEQKTNFIVSLVFGFCGAFAIFFSTPWGPSMGSDSVVYLLSAKNLVDVGYFGIIWGQGSFEPLAVNPPVLPLVIAGLYSSGMDVLSAMRIVDIVSFGSLLFFVGFLSYQITRKLSLSIQLSILFFCTPFIFALYTAAMSESLFYFFMVTGLLLLLLYLETESKSTLVFSAILAVGAFMTRYVGIVIPIACLLGIVFLGHQNQKTRIYDAFIFGLISFLVPLIWFFWNYLATSSLGGRIMTGEVGLWKPSIEFRLGLSSVIWNWMVLNSNVAVSYTFRKVSISLFLFGIGILCAVLFFKVFHYPKNKPYFVLIRWIILFALTAGLYVAVYFFAFALTMPTPDLFERTASPIYIAVIMVIFGMIYLAIEIWQGKKWLKWFPWALLVVMLTSYLPKTITYPIPCELMGVGTHLKRGENHV
jgi:Dolichyl-phosphate-mannose-protein mannosyltransferase